MKDANKPDHPLEYATPTPPKVGSPNVPVPYVIFGACIIPLFLGILMTHAGSEGGVAFGSAIAVTSAIAAIVLPIVSQMREK